jgi:hypothetical protein
MSDVQREKDDFYQAVAAIDAGDVGTLQRLLDAYPELATGRLDGSPDWLRDQIGDAVDGFFSRPYLLWLSQKTLPEMGSCRVTLWRSSAPSLARPGVPKPQTSKISSTPRFVSYAGLGLRRNVGFNCH